MIPWPHQVRGVSDVLAAIHDGQDRICLSCPTGGGKTWMVCELIRTVVEWGWDAIAYTNRKLLIDQLSQVLDREGISHGVRAAGYEDARECTVQISSLPTERSRTLKKGVWRPHGGHDRRTLAVVDEAHLNATETAKELLDYHVSHGGVALGVTATPIDLGWLYTKLIQAGTNSELRKCGALVWANHYAPDEPDMRRLKKYKEGTDLSEKQLREVVNKTVLWGRCWPWFEKLNPDRKPTILFASGVEESIWFAQQFTEKGVRAAHIDGQNVWVDGEFYKSDRDVRRQILDASRSGEITVLCNRFVLREGIDAPWLAHCILATVFGSLQSYLQSLGRVLRAYPGMEIVTIQDHGGNWWRHGDPNNDREWELGLTAGQVYGMRMHEIRERPEKQEFLCPKCKRVMIGPECLQQFGGCGYKPERFERSRSVVTIDGRLIEMKGDAIKPRPVAPLNLLGAWVGMARNSRKKRSSKTWNQLRAYFAYEYGGVWPDPKWPMTPRNHTEWYTEVWRTPEEKLIPIYSR